MQKGLKLLALFAIFPIYLFSYDAYWLKLLHFRSGESEIDDPHFFLAIDGKYNPKSEFEATIRAIKTDLNISCKYSARVEYIYKNYPNLVKDTPKKECKDLTKLLKDIDAKRAVLIFPTAHINSPASMFGHSFLRIDSKSSTTLTANAINYSANTDESNGLFFAYYGLTGGYAGKYSALPYYKKIKEYSNLESRDMWEYELNLSEDEIRRMLLHLYEIKDSYSDYYFFTKNCSYNLLWLLEIARPNLDLVNQFYYKAIPIDTIKAVKNAKLIKSQHFRASSNRKTRALIEAKNSSSGDLRRAYEIELDVEKLKLSAKAKKMDKKTYTRELIKKLSIRSKLIKTPKPTIKKPANPLISHKSTRLDIGVGDSGYRLGYKSAFHDVYDLDLGFEEGAYIDFFHIELQKSWQKDLKLNYFDFVKINSYAPIDELFSHISWGVSFGFEDFRDKNYFKLDGEVGGSYKIKNSIFYVVAKPSFHYRKSAIFGIGPKFGGFANFDSMKVGFSYENNFYGDGKSYEYSEMFSTFSITSDFAINLKLNSDNIKKRVDATLFYYF
jgi:hypothetical protein